MYKLFNYFEHSLLKLASNGAQVPLQIDITNACNLRCKHCYHTHHKNTGNLNFNQWVSVIDQYFSFTGKYFYEPKIVICGGEPLVSPLLFPILEYIDKNYSETKVSILTNGTLFNDFMLHRFQKIRSLNLRFQISLDGHNSETHNFIRGKGSFEKSLQGIELLKKHSIPFGVLAVLSKNSSENIEGFFQLAKDNEFESMNFTRFVSKGYGEGFRDRGEDRPLLPLELKESMKKIIIFSDRYDIKSAMHSPLFSLLSKKIGGKSRFWSSVIVDYQGNILMSSRSGVKIGHVFKEGIEKTIVSNSDMKKMKLGKIEKCQSCPHLAYCGGDRNAAYAEYGSFTAPDPGCWL